MGDIDFICKNMEGNEGSSTPANSAYKRDSRSVMKPCGIWAVMSPFNFLTAIDRSIGPLVTRNTQVFKPASNAPIIAYKFAKPDGVLNLVTGPGAQLGNEIAWNEDVGVVFTGSFKQYQSNPGP